ncbi:MAG: lipoyl synthase [Gammaproteobacteria bacterium]|nr:lipoyl synthase [Gammaproteobacteria bacterium]
MPTVKNPSAQRGAEKTARNPIKVTVEAPRLKKPSWIRVKAPTSTKVSELKALLRDQGLVTVCEEASCPNLAECFSHGTATFMIMGDVCTRRCPFCDVAHGRPQPLDVDEPARLAQTVKRMALRYVVVTSVDRDDLRDGGAQHFAHCIAALREHAPNVRVEILVPDFRARMDKALSFLVADPPDVFNHNLETVPRLYKMARPGADYAWSLTLLKRFKEACPDVPTKSGLMVGLGERDEEIIEVLHDMRAHGVDMVTIGQYLQPSRGHLPVERYLEPAGFAALGQQARALGFENVASGPLVRSSYHADLQASGQSVT